MKNSFEFWKGKKVLLTGHTGFKGTWLSVMLEQFGAEVCGYSLPLNPYSFYCKVHPKVTSHIEGDIADSEKVSRVISSFQPEIIIHLASHSSLDGSMKIPEYILRTNIMGVLNVLEGSRRENSVKAVVIVTSDKCYQNNETDDAYTESSPLGAVDPYSTSKVCQELLSSCYMNTFFGQENRIVGVATARASNVIGAGDYNISRLMPYLLECFGNGQIPQIRNPHAIRPWQYVLDVVYGYLILAEKLYKAANITTEYNGAYNFGPEKEGFREVGQVAKMVGRYYGNLSYDIRNDVDHIKKEAFILKLDSTKAKQVLNWRVYKKFDETIRLTVDFVVKEKAGILASVLCREQVMDYLEGVVKDV